VSIQNGAVLHANLPATVTCPTGHYTTLSASNGDCRNFSVPLLANNIFWQNRSFYITVGGLGTGAQNQQNVVTLRIGFSTTAAASEPVTDATTSNGGGVIITGGTGACVAGVAYWDIGVRGDSAQNVHNSGLTLSPTYSVLTDAGDYSGAGLTPANPTVISQYCNGSRTPPEFNATGYQVPPGISDATVPNPVFSLTPAATVDEGNNWVNIMWGPLSVTNPVTGVTLGNYGPAAGSPVIDAGTLTASGVAAPTTDFFGNPRVGNPDLGAIEFRAAGNGGGNTNPPQLTSINPSSGLRNATVAVTLNGTGLTGATAVTVSGTGVTVSGVTVVNDTTVTANFAISTTAALGARAVTVTTPNGTTNSVPFTVVLPSLTGIFPQTGLRGTTVAVTLTGANLTSPAVFTAVAGITISGATVVNSTTITANFVIAPAAATGVRNISVTTPSGLSNTVPFNVVAANVPVLTSISPSFGLRNNTVPVTLTGTNLNGATAITLTPGTGITAGFVSINPTTITASFIISSTAALGPRLVTITTPGGTSNAVQFTVPSALISSVAPSTGLRGQTLSLTLTGENFTGATGLTAAPATGLTISGFSVVNSTTATATLTIGATAVAGVHTFTIATPEGNTNAIPFTVIAPQLIAISPAQALRGGLPVPTGAPFPVTITGKNLTGITTITVSGSGVTVGPLMVVNDTTINTTFTISTTAAGGGRTVTVSSTPLGSSNTIPFQVLVPTITAVNPTFGLNGATMLTFAGTNLQGVNAGTVSGAGATLSAVTGATNGLSATASVTIATTATRSARTISLTGVNGATGTQPFTVAPFVSSLAPNSATRGTATISVPVVFTGVGLTGATAVNGALETGVTVTAFTPVSDTQVNATLSIAPTAAAATLPIGLVTPNGNSNSVNFTVN
jgi:hypothetical protein